MNDPEEGTEVSDQDVLGLRVRLRRLGEQLAAPRSTRDETELAALLVQLRAETDAALAAFDR